MFVKADYQQIIEGVKERNRLYKALIEIESIAENSSSFEDLETYQKHLQIILEKCKKALENVT